MSYSVLIENAHGELTPVASYVSLDEAINIMDGLYGEGKLYIEIDSWPAVEVVKVPTVYEDEIPF